MSHSGLRTQDSALASGQGNITGRDARMKSDLYTAIAELAAERNMPREVVTGAVEHALKTGYKKQRNIEEDENVRVAMNPDTGQITIVVDKEVVPDDDVEDPQRQIG